MISDFAVFKAVAGNTVYLRKDCIESFEPADWGVRVSTMSGDSHSLEVPLEYFVDKVFGMHILVAASKVDA